MIYATHFCEGVLSGILFKKKMASCWASVFQLYAVCVNTVEIKFVPPRGPMQINLILEWIEI